MERPVDLADEVHFKSGHAATKKLFQTDRTIVELVCMEPGQQVHSFEHKKREAFVHVVEGEFRFSPGDGPSELSAGMLAYFDGATPVEPRNTGSGRGVFVVTLVRKRDA